MAITFTTSDLEIDETAGVQLVDEGATLPSAYTYLLSIAHATGGEDANFPQVSYDANFLKLAIPAGTTVDDLVFTHLVGTTQTAFSTSVGVQTTLKDVDGNTIYLFADSTNPDVLIGRISSSPDSVAAFAIVLDDTTAGHTSAGAYVVLYEAMQHPTATNPNDIIDLTNQLFVSSATSTTTTSTTTSETSFDNFSKVPSGNNDYAIAGPTSGTGGNLLITGDAPKGNVNGQVGDATVNVSTTGLGSGSQSVGKNAVLQIDFVSPPLTGANNANTAGNEADLTYGAHLENVTSAQFSLTQVNPNNGELINLTVGAGNEQNNVKGGTFRDFIGTNVNITQVQVFDAAGNLIEDSDGTPNATGTNAVTATINAAGDAVLTNLRIDYTVKVYSTGMDQIRITNNDDNNNASFDIGEIKFAQTITTTTTTTTVGSDSQEVGSHVNIYDDGPSLSVATALGTLQVDETNFALNASTAISSLYTLNGGSDTATATYTLSATDGAPTGLTATGTNTAIVLDVISPTQVNGVDGSGNVIFSVSINNTGNLVLDQQLAIKHPTTAPNESLTLASGLITLNVDAADKDGDAATTLPIDVSSKLTFLDDGVSLTVGDATGTYDADAHGSFTDSPGGDLFGSLALTFDSYAIAGGTAKTTTVSNSTFTQTGPLTFSGTVVDDFNADGKADTVGFNLTFNQTTDSYDFTVTTPPDPGTTVSSADGSLKAGAPDGVRTLLFGGSESNADDVVFFGVVANALTTGGAGTADDLFDLIVKETIAPGVEDLTESQIEALNSPLVTSATKMNVSTAGIGINNNNLDGSGVGIQASDESFVFNPEQIVDSVKVFIDNSVGGYDTATEDLFYTVYYTDGTVGTTTEVNTLTSEAGNQVSFEIDGGTKQIDAVQFTMARGTIKIPFIEWSTESTFDPDALDLNFTATETDKDKDFATDQFSIHLSPSADLIL